MNSLPSAIDALRGATRSAAALEIEYFTDPLCSWSWAFEPQWQRVRSQYGNRIQWRYRMAGLIPSWNAYSDPLNCVNRPAQMAPQWIEVRHITGVYLEPRLWLHDPPCSRRAWPSKPPNSSRRVLPSACSTRCGRLR